MLKLLLMLVMHHCCHNCFIAAIIGKENRRGKRPEKIEARGREEAKDFYRFSCIILVSQRSRERGRRQEEDNRG